VSIKLGKLKFIVFLLERKQYIHPWWAYDYLNDLEFAYMILEVLKTQWTKRFMD
jgi:hypothetical protein